MALCRAAVASILQYTVVSFSFIATLTKMMPHLGVQTTSGSRVSYDRTNRENDSSEMNYSNFEGTSVQTVHLRGNPSTSGKSTRTNFAVLPIAIHDMSR